MFLESSLFFVDVTVVAIVYALSSRYTTSTIMVLVKGKWMEEARGRKGRKGLTIRKCVGVLTRVIFFFSEEGL